MFQFLFSRGVCTVNDVNFDNVERSVVSPDPVRPECPDEAKMLYCISPILVTTGIWFCRVRFSNLGPVSLKMAAAPTAVTMTTNLVISNRTDMYLIVLDVRSLKLVGRAVLIMSGGQSLSLPFPIFRRQQWRHSNLCSVTTSALPLLYHVL